MQVAAVDLDVAGLVDDLGGGVELGVEIGHALHDLRRAHEGTLLTVHELREAPGRTVAAHLVAILLAHPGPQRGVGDGNALIRHAERVARIDLERPVQAIRTHPLLARAAVVQTQQLLTAALVVEVEGGGHRRVDVPRGAVCGSDQRGAHGVSMRTAPRRGMENP